MSLLQQLTEAADSIDPSLLPSSNDVQKLTGAIAHFLEHGEAFLKAAERGAEDVSDLLTGQPEPDTAAADVIAEAAAPAATPAPADPTATTPTNEELEAEIQRLQVELATSRQTSASPSPSSPPGTSES